MKSLLLAAAIAVAALGAPQAEAQNSGKRVAFLAESEGQFLSNKQEKTPADWFLQNYPDGQVVYCADAAAKLTRDNFDAVWVHIDRCGIAAGYDNLPAAFRNAMPALKAFYQAGGNVFLSKHATQMVCELGCAQFFPGIFGSGDGGEGFDNWQINAQLGYISQCDDNWADYNFYDHRRHDIYKGMETEMRENSDECIYSVFPTLGTGDDATSMWREDHNCMWDLNSFTYTTEGKTTLEKYEAQEQCTVLGTWGHVVDYCVAGIVEYAKTAQRPGLLIANGLAAYEWAPRNGGNAYTSNIEKLTSNTLNYLADKAAGIEDVATDAIDQNAPVEFFNLQGQRIAEPANGLYIRRQGNTATKVIL